MSSTPPQWARSGQLLGKAQTAEARMGSDREAAGRNPMTNHPVCDVPLVCCVSFRSAARSLFPRPSSARMATGQLGQALEHR